MRKMLLLSLCGWVSLYVQAQQVPAEEAEEILKIKQLSNSLKAEFWPEWSDTPFSILLVTESYEYLIGHPNAGGFSDSFYLDSAFMENVYYRPKSFPLNMAATFPLIDEYPVIVMGAIEHANFGKKRWAWTLFHEHFHQFQMLSEGYYQNSKELDLARDSTDFMWPLDYPFPYDDPEVSETINRLAEMLNQGWKEENVPMEAYYELRKELKRKISGKDYRYFNFQVWQEGLPRYLEIFLAREMVKPGSTEIQQLLDEYNNEIEKVLADPKMNERGRILFYSLGAAEWAMIDKSGKDWKKEYLQRPFEMDYLFE